MEYLKQWSMSSDEGGGDYIVSLLAGDPIRPGSSANKFACSCPGWTRNVAKFCPDCGERLGRGKPPHCWHCRKDVPNPRVERIECKHILRVRAGAGVSMEDAVLKRMVGR